MIKAVDIHRKAYVIDAKNGTFDDAAPLMRVPQGSFSRSEHSGRLYDGDDGITLSTWECRTPPTDDVYIIESVAIVRLSDGRHEVCRFRPLVFANRRIVNRKEDTD